MVNTRLLQKASIGMHIAQMLFSVVVMGVMAASMLQDGRASGPARFMFALTWLSLPGHIYLVMTPRFQRTRMLAHPYWVLGINVIYTIFWFAAFIALATYTNKGISNGKNKEKDDKIKDKGGCALFPAGTGETEKACSLNKSGVGLGVFMWFLWLTTLGIASWAAWYFSRNSVSPFEDLSTPSHDITETTKDAFSSNDEYALINKNRHDDYDDDLEGSHVGHYRTQSAASTSYPHSGYSDSAHPGQQVEWANDREPYAGIGGHAPIAPHGDMSMPEGPDDYSYRGAADTSYRGRV
ncbi:hypothetical protein EX30DRAFT_398276 [Ascodesmis nigricans]|uniref:MARVEL domain-containing protein n=1 Tax=Ascodesmis nigricans TaxID=341454 RepID=A0A4S2MLK3_9PEZI|nr:hypothetical protein EX30DRAFT_398276 [Ascodesmis nigricans]